MPVVDLTTVHIVHGQEFSIFSLSIGKSLFCCKSKLLYFKQVDFGKNVSAPYSVVASLQPIIKFCMHFLKCS